MLRGGLRPLGALLRRAPRRAAGTVSALSSSSGGGGTSSAVRVVVPDYDAYLSERSRARQPSAIRALQPLLSEPGMISLGGGMPNPETFPFDEISVEIRGNSSDRGGADESEILDHDSASASGPGLGSFTLRGSTLDAVLQYSNTRGLPGLVSHLSALQRREHGSAQPEPFEICVTTGSQDALTKAFDLFTGAGESDAPMMVESPTYSGSLAYLQPTGTPLVRIDCDEGGIIPDKLRTLLATWDGGPFNVQRPQVLYTIPVGSNPTGASLSLARKEEIYAIAREFDVLILEDDPYYWMQYDVERTPSFFSMDVDGRVLRFDSFSKLLSSGLRVGFVTGPPALIERIELHAQASVLHSSGISQALVAGLFDSWGIADAGTQKEGAQEGASADGSSYSGFVKHCASIVEFYQRRRDAFLQSADRHLTGLCEWRAPSAGMFVWIKLPVGDADHFIKTKARDAKVLLVPGQSFDPHDRPSPYVRAAFSTASLEDMDTAVERLGRLLREHLVEVEGGEKVEKRS